MRHCIIADYAHYTSFDCRKFDQEPIYILSRNCTNQYYGANGPCCKVDDALNYLINDRPTLFAKIKFILHSDDDEYWRADQVMRWLVTTASMHCIMYRYSLFQLSMMLIRRRWIGPGSIPSLWWAQGHLTCTIHSKAACGTGTIATR
jgi:hypothetical protein